MHKEFLMGNVDEGIIRTDLQEEFKCCNVYAREKCKDCFAKFYCSGGCAANAWKYNGDIRKPYEITCAFEKKRTECAIGIFAAERDR